MPAGAVLNRHDRLHAVDLAAGPLKVLFSEDALTYGAALDLYREHALVFHLKYMSLRQGFVLNDLRDGQWGAELFIRCGRPLAGGGLLTILETTEERLEVRLPGQAAISLGDRFDVTGPLRVEIPSTITLVEEASELNEWPAKHGPAGPPCQAAWDALVLSESCFYLEGWMDDRSTPVGGFSLLVAATSDALFLPAYRLRRPDVDNHLHPVVPHEFGIWTAGQLPPGVGLGDLGLLLVGPDGHCHPVRLPQPTHKPAADFLDFALQQFGRRPLLGDLTVRSLADLDAGFGAMLAGIHQKVAATRTTRIEARFGPRSPACRLSLVCVLLGIPDFLYLLVSQFARFGPLDGLEFVFVSNSPELEEVLVRDAELASFVFKARIIMVGLNQNCGFSHANNVGVGAAQGTTICIINPDVFPRDAAAVAQMLRLAEDDLGDSVVGGKLYYADGSVMHEGMFFAQDRRLAALSGGAVWMVEHFRKGFPDTNVPAQREVPAISGALMVLERKLYERMGGFDTDFIFGHYEDADLCLRIRQAGGRVVLDPALAYWHYEGTGSAKLPAHAGARLYNRWLFMRRWGDRLEAANRA